MKPAGYIITTIWIGHIGNIAASRQHYATYQGQYEMHTRRIKACAFVQKYTHFLPSGQNHNTSPNKAVPAETP